MDQLSQLSFNIKQKTLDLNKTGICVKLELTTAAFLNLYLSIKTQLPVHVWTRYIEWKSIYNIKPLFPLENIPDNGIYINTFLLEQSEKKQLLLLSNRDYVETNYTRQYHRSEIVDYFPLSQSNLGINKLLRWSQIYNLYDQINSKQYPEFEDYKNYLPKLTDKAYNTDITYEEYEWLMDIENISNYSPEYVKIVKDDRDPTKHPKWFTFTIRQKQIIAQLHQIEKQTRYKDIRNSVSYEI